MVIFQPELTTITLAFPTAVLLLLKKQHLVITEYWRMKQLNILVGSSNGNSMIRNINQHMVEHIQIRQHVT